MNPASHKLLSLAALFLLIFVSPRTFAQTTGFADIAGGLFNISCVNCHDSGKSGSARNSAPFSVNFNTYSWAVLNAERGNSRVQAGTMPPTGERNAAEKALFQSWLDAGTPVGEVVGYADMRSNIFEETCLNCHSSDRSGAARNGAPSSVNFNTYELAYANASRGNARVQAGTMPPAGARTGEQKALFQDWVNLDTPLGEQVDYARLKENIFSPICLNCHDSNKSGSERNSAPEDVNFDTYSKAAASAYRANNQVQAGFMPPSGALTFSEKAMFLDWVYNDLAGEDEPSAPLCDFDGNGTIAITDVIALLLFQRANPGDLGGDFNGDGAANVTDAIAMLIAFRDGTCPDAQ